MRLVLCRNRSLGSLALRAWMGSRWSHAAIWDDDAGLVYDATLSQGGVRRTHEAGFFAHYPDYRVIEINVADPLAARRWLYEQIGKPYDWTALVGIFFRARDWSDDDAWFCSEFAEAFRSLFERRRFAESLSRITPYHLDILAYDER